MNVLLIHSDQHRHDCIRAHGIREDIQTPNLDRLCAGGVTFTRAYTTIPICTPARASLLTGTWPTRHGSLCIPSSELNRSARPELPTLFDKLKEKNVRTGWVGKYHGEIDIPKGQDPGPEQGVDTYVPLWHYGKKCEAEHIPRGKKPHGLFGDENTVTPPSQSSLAWQADEVIRLLRQSGDEPFFIRWDPPEPHLPCNPVSEFAGRYTAGDMRPWRSFPDPQEGKPLTQKRQKKIWGLENWSWERWQPIVRLYYGIISELDHHIGRVLEALEEAGATEDTLVIYSTDHGDYCGGHGQLDKHFNMYDDVCRVPLILRCPGTVPSGETRDAFASNSIDLARTILEAAGCEVPDTFRGENLLTMAANADYRPREVITSQYFGTESGAYSMRMIRDDRYKFVYHPVGDTHEFYDLDTDPGELVNRIGDQEVEEHLVRLKARLWDEMKVQGDPLANRWTEVELKDAPVLSAKHHML